MMMASSFLRNLSLSDQILPEKFKMFQVDRVRVFVTSIPDFLVACFIKKHILRDILFSR